MELTVRQEGPAQARARMQGVAERKSTMPVLSNVLLAVDGPSVLLCAAATDLYLALVGRVTVDVSKGGSVAVPAKDLLERLRMMPEGPIHLSTQDNASTTIKASGSARRYTLRGMPGDDFPPIPTPAEGSPSLAIDVEVLQELVAKTHFSISTDETRAHLNSALFEWDGRRRTDGHDRRTSALEDGGEGERSAGLGDDADSRSRPSKSFAVSATTSWDGSEGWIERRSGKAATADNAERCRARSFRVGG
jgi:DNA polymerase-3 subunit beta